MKRFIGIDPGQKGGIAIIDKQSIIEIEVHDIPKNACDLYNILQHVDNADIFCMLEQAQPMPKQGVKGVFTYGIGYGKIIAVLEILGIPFQTIHPSVWKKEFSLYKKNKKVWKIRCNSHSCFNF